MKPQHTPNTEKEKVFISMNYRDSSLVVVHNLNPKHILHLKALRPIREQRKETADGSNLNLKLNLKLTKET